MPVGTRVCTWPAVEQGASIRLLQGCFGGFWRGLCNLWVKAQRSNDAPSPQPGTNLTQHLRHLGLDECPMQCRCLRCAAKHLPAATFEFAQERLLPPTMMMSFRYNTVIQGPLLVFERGVVSAWLVIDCETMPSLNLAFVLS